MQPEDKLEIENYLFNKTPISKRSFISQVFNNDRHTPQNSPDFGRISSGFSTKDFPRPIVRPIQAIGQRGN